MVSLGHNFTTPLGYVALTVRNLAIDIRIFWSAPLISANARTFIAVGPMGIIIKAHHNIGSLGSISV